MHAFIDQNEHMLNIIFHQDFLSIFFSRSILEPNCVMWLYEGKYPIFISYLFLLLFI